MRILLTGASGFVGAALAPCLLERGHEVRAYARDRDRVHSALSWGRTRAGADAILAEIELVLGDTLSGTGLREAMRGIDVAYYLIHSMEPAAQGSFAERERDSARKFARAARAAGVERIVYLGGPRPPSGADTSTHLASRAEVERILLRAAPDSVALRASIVIGARSRSFRFLVRLVERLPVLALPAWRRHRTRPIDERDIVEMLTACATLPASPGAFDVGGPDALSYSEILQRIAELMMLARPTVGLSVSATPIAARVAAVLAGEDPELVLPLMEGLDCDLLAHDSSFAELLGVRLHKFDSAVEHALGEWEKVEELAAR